jgi:hypothetical protein
MSTVLHLWAQPVPTSVAQAQALVTQLAADTATAPPPAFVALAKQLTARHPCITTLDDDDPSAVWSDGSLDGRTRGPLWTLGLLSGAVRRVLPFVAASAGALGLTVFDPQTAQVYLPCGQVLTLPGRAPVRYDDAPDDSELHSKAQVHQLLVDGLRPVLEPHGFKVLKGSIPFKRKGRGCVQEILFDINDYAPLFEWSLSTRFAPNLDAAHAAVADSVADVYADFSALALAQGIHLTGERGYSWRFAARTPAELAKSLAEARAMLTQVGLPLLNRCDTAAGLDDAVNGTDAAIRAVFTRSNFSLLLAHAVGNPRFDLLVTEMRQHNPSDWAQGKINDLVAALDRLKATP